MDLTFHGVVPTVALLCYVLLLVAALRRGVQYRVVSTFVLYLLSMCGWSLAALMIYLQPSRIGLWGDLMLLFGSIAMPLTVYAFSRTFVGSSPFSALLYAGLVVGAALAGLVFEGQVQQFQGLSSRGEILYEFGPAIPFTATFWLVLIGVSGYVLFKGYRQTPDTATRKRILLALIGLGFVLLGTLTNSVDFLGSYPWDILANVMNALLITVGILRYKFLDVAFDVRRGLVHSLTVVGIALTYLLTFYGAQYLPSMGIYIVLVIFTLLLTVSSIRYPGFGSAVVGSLDRMLFQEKHRAREDVRKLSQDLTATLDMDQIVHTLLAGVVQAMSLDHAVLFLRTPEGYKRLSQDTKALASAPVSLALDHPIARLLADKGSATLQEFQSSGAYRALWSGERADLEDLNVELFLGLRSTSEQAGILGLGKRSAKQPYTEEDRLVLATLANQAATAMEKARLYQDLQTQYRELKSAQVALVQSEKLAAVGELVSGVAHELNNPLTSVLGFADLLRRSADDPNTRQDLETIYVQAQRAARIVRSLLTFARQNKVEKTVVSLNDAIVAAQDLITYQLRLDNIRLTLDLDPNLPMVEADFHQVQQIFVNLVTNAQQAIRETGREGNISILSSRVPGGVQVRVSDDGPGIPDGVLERIFDPFFTTKEVGEGTGLGLSICYGIVQDHGGRIWAESEYGRGANFLLEFPTYDGAQVTQAASTIALQPGNGDAGGARILVVDDEESLASLLNSILLRDGHEVDAYQGGAEALRAIAKAEGRGQGYDIILTDVKMPGMNGIELYRELERLSAAIAGRVIFCTGDTASPRTQAFLEDTGNPVLCKPFRNEQVSDLVGEVLAQRQAGKH